MTEDVLPVGLDLRVIESVMMGPLVITVSTDAVITVCPTLHVTNKRDSASEDVTRDIPPVTVVKLVHLDILGWTVKNVVAAIV